MSRIFISHSSADNFAAIAFHDWLLAEGWAQQDVFIDLHDLNPGERWKDALKKANERCEAVVFLASPASLTSTECRLELRMAEDYGKEIIVALLPLLKVDDPALGPYRDRQIVDLGENPRDVVLTPTHKQQTETVYFSQRTLRAIKARLDQLGIAPNAFVWRPKVLDTASPYPGFEGFSDHEAALFFGRAADIARGLAEVRKLRRMGTGQVLLIQAASGAGKSSFLKAGLWPRLMRDPEFATLAILRPATGIITGENGLGRRLAATFADRRIAHTAASIHQALAGDLDHAADRLIAFINEAVAAAHAVQSIMRPDAGLPTPLIAVDQAEELFAASDAEESRRFLGLVARLLDPQRAEQRPSSQPLAAAPLLIWTLRADSLDTLMHSADATGLKAPQPFLLPPMPREAYREIIEQPLAVANQAGMKVEIDPLLTSELVRAATGADALPLLAFTLRQLMADSRTGTRAKLTLADYEASGGTEGVLRKRLAAAQLSAGATDLDLRRLMIPGLATWDEEANPPAAKRLVIEEADVLTGPRTGLKRLVDALVDARLLTRSGGEGGRATLEVAHEALLRAHPIVGWLHEDREFLVWLANIARARQLDAINTGDLFFGGPMEDARRWLAERQEDIPADDRAFVEAALTAEERKRAEQSEWEKRRLTEAFELRSSRERELAAQRVTRRTLAGLAASVMLALMAGGLGWSAMVQQREAQKQASRAELSEQATAAILRQSQIAESGLLSTAARLLSDQPGGGGAPLAMLLALEGMPDERSDDPQQTWRLRVAETTVELDRAYFANRERTVLGHNGEVIAVAWSPDGTLLATGSNDKTARIVDVATGKQISSIAHDDKLIAVAWSPDSTRLVTGSTDKTARIVDAATGKEIARVAHDEPVTAVAWSPDGTRLLTGSKDKTARIVDATTGKEMARVAHDDWVTTLAWSPDGARLITGSTDKTARIVDAATGKEIARVAHDEWVTAVAWNPDGTRLATGSNDKTARIVDAATGHETVRVAHDQPVTAVAWSPDGARLVTGSNDATARIVEAATGNEIARAAHNGRVLAVAWSPDGTRLVTGSNDATARILDAATGKEIARVAHDREVTAVAWSPDGTQLITASNDKTARIVEAVAGKEVTRVAHDDHVQTIAWSPDSTRLVTGSNDQTARIVDAATGKETARVAHDGIVTAVAWSPDGNWLATGSTNQDRAQVRIIESVTGREIARIAHDDQVLALAWSPDGSRLATGSNEKTVRIVEVASALEIASMKHGDWAVAWSSDGTRLATGSTDNTARIFEVATGIEITRLQHQDQIFAVAWSPDGTRLATGSADYTARIFEAESGREIVRVSHEREVQAVAWSPDGTQLATGSSDKTVLIVEAATGTVTARVAHDGDVFAVAWSPDGKALATASADRTARILRVSSSPQKLVDSAKRRSARCLTKRQREQYFLQPSPPTWCIERRLWPYHSDDWQVWLPKQKTWLAAGRQGEPPLLPKAE